MSSGLMSCASARTPPGFPCPAAQSFRIRPGGPHHSRGSQRTRRPSGIGGRAALLRHGLNDFSFAWVRPPGASVASARSSRRASFELDLHHDCGSRWAPGCCRGQAALRLHRRIAAHWRPDRGTARSHLVARRSRCDPTRHHGVAFGARWRRHQDQEVTPHVGATAAPHRRAPSPTVAARTSSVSVRGTGGTITTWCSPPGSVLRSTQATSAVRSVLFLLLLASTRQIGRRASCGTASSRCCRTRVSRSRRSLVVGHTGTTTTETVYRKQIRPVVIGGT